MSVKRHELQNDLAMTVGLVSFSMLFVTLFMGYFVYRTSTAVWPPEGFNPVPLILPIVSTLMIGASSWFCHRTQVLTAQQSFTSARRSLWVTLALGVGFLVCQTLLWMRMNETGIYVGSGVFASILYGFTWIHAAHMLLGLGGLIYLLVVLRPETRLVWQKSVNVEKFWHFLGIVWFVMFLGLFVF